ncbi:hypothetical protein TanjilG_11954 [Lupinus angustifolius]|uniref:Uncharacterized protein n=1 Tax=Lupinus angustifolius TaxID=3871 RepID=A0A1J7H377_LUPAN|nr:hypothetical protein TanjilG_11954 [Lupinus angustifolius]
MRSFREDTKSFRSNITISSTASSPGYTLRDKKKDGRTRDTRDVGTQSTPTYLSSSCTSPASTTPSITERSKTRPIDSSNSKSNTKSQEEMEVKDKETLETKETEKEKNEWMKEEVQYFKQSGCFSWIKKKRKREKNRQKRNNIFLTHFNGC